MKGSKITDKKKSKLIEAKINNPDLKLKDLEKLVGIDHTTASRILNKELPEVAQSSKNIASLIDVNNNLQSLADKRIAKMVKNGETNIRLSELVSLRESTFKQNRLIQGESTENLSTVGEEQANTIIARYLGKKTN